MSTESTLELAFRRLLVRTAGADGDARAIAAAAHMLCEEFAGHVAPLIGEGGISAIYSRSFHLTEPQFASAAPLRSPHPGEPLGRLQNALEQQGPDVAIAAATAMLTTTVELLASFIGHVLTTRLLHEVWPDDFRDDGPPEINI
jgi:hypothetical protein